jgi:hypothetical protein
MSLGRIGEKAEGYPGFDEIVMPDCQDVVRIRPLTVRDERKIGERDDASKALMTDHVMHILAPIVEINGGKPDNWEQVLQWFNALSPMDAPFLEAQENLLYPHLETDLPHRCDRCQNEFTHSLDLSKDFFRRRLKPGKGAAIPADVRPGNEQQKPDSGAERPTG